MNNQWNNGQPNSFGMYNQPGYTMSPNMNSNSMQPQIAPQPRIAPPPQQSFGVLGVPGRWIDGIEEVQPGEVPMDGTICFFPKKDCSKIYAKVWDQNGKLRDFVFVPEAPVQTESVSEIQRSEQFDKIVTELENIKKQLATMNKPYRPKNSKKTYYSKPNKDKEDKI